MRFPRLNLSAAFSLAAVLMAVAAPASAQDFGDFTLTTSGGDGGVTELSPVAGYDLAFQIRGNDGGGSNVFTRFQATATADILVEFSWSYETTDLDGPSYDPAGYTIAGIDTALTDPSGANNQSGDGGFDVAAGQSYGWYVNSTDGCCGAGFLTVNLRFVGADTEPPVFADVPDDISTGTDPGEDTAVVTWTAPTATDNVDGAVTPVQTAGPAPGSAFPLGSTTITYTATDTAGNVATASFTVTVGDTEPPVFADVPDDISTDTDPGEDTAVVTWTVPTATDNVDGAVTPVQTAGPAPGSAFPLGNTTITYTATDTAGNVATASFTVTVAQQEYDPELTSIDVANATIIANGTDSTQLVVNVRDVSGNLLGRGGMNVTLRTTLGSLGPVIDQGDGRYTSVLFAGTRSGTATITGATDGVPIAGSATVQIEPDRALIAETFADVAGAFMQRRIDRILASEPRFHRLDRRREVQPGTHFALELGGQGGDIAGRMFLSGEFGMRPTGGLDVSGIENGIPSRNLSFALQSVSHDRRWHLWAQGQFSRYVDGTGSLADRRGDFGIVHLGGDYLLNDRLALGMMAHFDHTRERILGFSTVYGHGWMVGPYLSSELADGVFLTARAAWGESSNRAAIDVHDDGNIWSGNFRTQRVLARVALSGVHEHRSITFRPELDLSWMEERQRRYGVTDGNAIVDVDGVRASIARLSFSGETEWPIVLSGSEARAFLLPVLGLDVGGTGAAMGHPALQGSLEMGLRTSENAIWRGEAAIRFDGLGQSSFRGWSIRLGADMRF